MSAWAILCDGDFDQIVESSLCRTKEVRDLTKMGFKVTTKKFPRAADAEAWADKQRGY